MKQNLLVSLHCGKVEGILAVLTADQIEGKRICVGDGHGFLCMAAPGRDGCGYFPM